MSTNTSPPPSKRVRLGEDDDEDTPILEPGRLDDPVESDDNDDDGSEIEDGEHCSICLQVFVDRAVIPECAHDFCFECILKWTGEPPLFFCLYSM